MPYTLSVGSGTEHRFIKSAEIIAQLDPAVPFQLAHIRSVERLEREKCHYTNQDFDVLSSARAAIGKTETPPHAAKWVEFMTAL